MARMKSFKAEYGASAEIDGIWHKFYAGVEIELSEGDDTTKVKEMAWNTVKVEVENQVREVTNELGR